MLIQLILLFTEPARLHRSSAERYMAGREMVSRGGNRSIHDVREYNYDDGRGKQYMVKQTTNS
jgi:hypothetical protein